MPIHQLPRFSGYFAAPLKGVYLQPYKDSPKYLTYTAQVRQALEDKNVQVESHMKDGFYRDAPSLLLTNYSGRASESPWIQDEAWILEKGGQTVVARPGLCYTRSDENAQKLANTLNLPYQELRSAAMGGNCFLGKRPDGKKFALIGRDSLDFTKYRLAALDMGLNPNYEQLMDYEATFKARQFKKIQKHFNTRPREFTLRAMQLIGEDFGVTPDQLQFISQPNFHIDMMVRPLTYPKVLVQDFGLTQQLIEQALEQTTDPDEKKLLNDFLKETQHYEADLTVKEGGRYTHPDKVAEELVALGYEVVRIPATMEAPQQAVNYTNAIVHQDPSSDQLTYVTNAATLPILNQLFADYLQKACPEVERVEFIAGTADHLFNDISHTLKRLEGGIHCLSAEHPNFEAWA